MPTLASAVLCTISAIICCAATLLEDSGRSFRSPGTRPYHLPDLFFTFLAPGVPFGTLRDFTNLALGASRAQGRPSGSSQASYSQYWITLTLNTLVVIASSLFLVEGRAGQAQ